jgi:hypothetical protein
MILESEGGRIAINPDKFDKLITALRTAVDDDGTLDKEATSYSDIFDAFRLALKFYHFENSGNEHYVTSCNFLPCDDNVCHFTKRFKCLDIIM